MQQHRDFEVGLFDCCASPGGCQRCCFVACCHPCAVSDLAARLPTSTGAVLAGQRAATCALCSCYCSFGCLAGVLQAAEHAGQTAGQTAAVTWADPTGWVIALATCYTKFTHRRGVRRVLGLHESDTVGDILISYFCGSCALCQQLNQLDRGMAATHGSAGAGPYKGAHATAAAVAPPQQQQPPRRKNRKVKDDVIEIDE
jgi:Cys-rich protein (TIGR01571 family)